MKFINGVKLNCIFCLLIIRSVNQANGQCASPFNSGDTTDLCYYSDGTSASWSDGYDRCLGENVSGILMEILTRQQFNALTNVKMKGSFWLGANNFASFYDSQWHWLDGSIVQDSVITWCPNSTHETAIGTYCAAYNTEFNCVSDYPCSTPLPAPCVATTNIQTKSITSRASSSGICTNSYGGAYANWWTYSILLLNWFLLFCLTLYIINSLNLNTVAMIIAIGIAIIAFMMMITFSVLWGVQYQDLSAIPVAVVVVGCAGGLLFLLDILFLVSSPTRVQRWKACTILTSIVILIELALMLGLILCITYCSGYISMVSTSLDKDVIASLLSSIVAAISIIFYNTMISFLGYTGRDRIHASRSASVPQVATQATAVRRSETRNGVNSNKIERATSPVDQRIITEFYSDQPRDMHQYRLDGRQYVVYEGSTFGDITPYRKDITQAMLTQDAQGLRDSIARIKSSPHAAALNDEIRQAERLLSQLK